MASQGEILRAVGQALDNALEDLCGERLGFALFVFRFNTPGMSNYISNGDRETMITALRETTKRLEANEVIGEIIGHA